MSCCCHVSVLFKEERSGILSKSLYRSEVGRESYAIASDPLHEVSIIGIVEFSNKIKKYRLSLPRFDGHLE
jgi:hypothetical protein